MTIVSRAFKSAYSSRRRPVGQSGRWAAGLLAAVSATCIPLGARADQVMIQATGKITFVNAALGTAFREGGRGQMVLMYTTEARDSDPSPTIGTYKNNAVTFFQIADASGTPYHSYKGDVGGTITVTDGGARGDGFAFTSFSDVRFAENPDDGLRGPRRNNLPLLEVYFNLQGSDADVFTGDALPTVFGKDDADWSSNPDNAPHFGLQYCSSCGNGGGFGRAVSFEIDEVEIEPNQVSVSFTKGMQASGVPALFLNGEIDPSSLHSFEIAQAQFADIKTLVLNQVPGSADDDTNLKITAKVHAAGYTTVVPKGGLIASGGVDLFLSGVTRTLEEGACVGVHSWSDSSGKEGKDFPRDSAEHKKYLDYFKSIGVPEALYWFTLDAAPAGEMHWMTQDEVTKYSVATSPAPVLGTKAECDGR